MPTDSFSNSETESFIPTLDPEYISQGVPNGSVASRVGTRVRKQTQKMKESKEQKHLRFSTYYECMNERDYKIQDSMSDPITFKASIDFDVLYYHQAVMVDDSDQCIEVLVNEINDHYELYHWEIIPCEQAPDGQHILDSIWTMKRKRDIKTREVYK